MSSSLLTEIDGGIMTLRMNRPEVRNAMNTEMRLALSEKLARAAEDPEIRVIVLTGEGTVFCSGADLSEYRAQENLPLVELYRRTTDLADVLRQMQYVGKPVVGQVNGPALAGGMGLALGCDLVVASDRARFGFPEINRGFVAALVMVQLSRLMGRKKALELLMLGEMIPAEEARGLGLVNRVVPHDRLEEETRALAQKLAAKPPLAMQLTKDLFYATEDSPTGPGLQAARAFNLLARQDRAFAEEVQRFLNR